MQATRINEGQHRLQPAQSEDSLCQRTALPPRTYTRPPLGSLASGDRHPDGMTIVTPRCASPS